MRINQYNSSPLLNKKKNKLIYKNYIYNLFKYNEEKRKKLYTNQNEEQKFNVFIKNIYTPKRNKPEKYLSLQHNTYENNRLLNAAPTNLKKLNLNLNVSNLRDYSKKLFNINKEINKNCNSSRNTNRYAELIKSNFSLMNGFLSNSIKKSKVNLKDKCLFLRPISKKKLKIEYLENNNETEYISNYSIYSRREKNKSNKSKVPSTCNKIHSISNRNRIEKYLTRPSSRNHNKRIKLTYVKDINDMRPRNRFTIFKKELLRNEVKNNILYIKSERSLSKNKNENI